VTHSATYLRQTAEIASRIDAAAVEWPQGMNVTIVTTARTDEECLALLREFGLPLREA
jgi:ribosomal protein L5